IGSRASPRSWWPGPSRLASISAFRSAALSAQLPSVLLLSCYSCCSRARHGGSERLTWLATGSKSGSSPISRRLDPVFRQPVDDTRSFAFSLPKAASFSIASKPLASPLSAWRRKASSRVCRRIMSPDADHAESSSRPSVGLLPVVRLAGFFHLGALCQDALDLSTGTLVAHAHFLKPAASDLRGAGFVSHRLLLANHASSFSLADVPRCPQPGAVLARRKRRGAPKHLRRRRRPATPEFTPLRVRGGAWKLGLFDLRGLLAAAAAVILEHKGDLVALVEGADARPLERAGMDEHVLGAVLGRDEAEALGAVEELDCSGDSHGESPSRRA